MNKAALARAKQDKALLLANGYIVREFTPYHWHVRRKGNPRIINVWPTAGKWVEVGAHDVQRYSKVMDAVDAALNDPEVHQQEEAQAKIAALRSGGLAYLRKKASR